MLYSDFKLLRLLHCCIPWVFSSGRSHVFMHPWINPFPSTVKKRAIWRNHSRAFCWLTHLPIILCGYFFFFISCSKTSISTCSALPFGWIVPLSCLWQELYCPSCSSKLLMLLLFKADSACSRNNAWLISLLKSFLQSFKPLINTSKLPCWLSGCRQTNLGLPDYFGSHCIAIMMKDH